MKKLILFLSFIIIIKGLNAQTIKPEYECPKGSHAVGISYSIDKFNFHKPRTSCTSGFGLCVQGHLEPRCVSDFGGYPVPILQNDKVTYWYQIIGSKVELHLPASFKTDDSFKNMDLSNFYIDPDMTEVLNEDGSRYGFLKEGVYPVVESGNELIITIDVI